LNDKNGTSLQKKNTHYIFFGGNLIERNGGIQIKATVLPGLFPFYFSLFFLLQQYDYFN
jgi:hypothetical protein